MGDGTHEIADDASFSMAAPFQSGIYWFVLSCLPKKMGMFRTGTGGERKSFFDFE